MVTVEEARIKLAQLFSPGKITKIKLNESLGYVLAAPVIAPENIPPFDNSAMDGYALNMADWDGKSPFKITGESAAGDNVKIKLQPGNAMRIFTGAMVPEGATAVVMQEKTRVADGFVFAEDEKLHDGMNIRMEGSQTEKGDKVLEAGHWIHAGSIGFLASIGIDKLEVFEKPSVKIIVTGKEIVPPGNSLQPGEVFECNSYSLSAALKTLGIDPHVKVCKDDLQEITKAVSEALYDCDVLLVTGGISVGDYDFVLPALMKNNVQELFYKVRQKPAKPLFMGKTANAVVFGLPGNPASVLTSYHVYVKPIILSRMGHPVPMKSRRMKVNSDIHKKPGMVHFIKGFYAEKEVEVLPGQESYRMDAFAFANCLIEIPEQTELVKAGEEVTIIPF